MQPPINQPPYWEPEPVVPEPMPRYAPRALPPDVPFLIITGVAWFVGFLALALAVWVPYALFTPDVIGVALAAWGTGFLTLFLGMAARRIEATRRNVAARARGVAAVPRPQPSGPAGGVGGVPPDAILVIIAGLSLFLGILAFAFPLFVPSTYQFLTALYGVAVVAMGLGILLLLVSFAARTMREARPAV